MRIIFQTGLLLLFLFVSIQSAYACGCPHMSFEEKIAATNFVFVGKVVQITEDTSRKRKPYERRRYLVKLKIGEKFKGVRNNEITLVQYEDIEPSSCPQWNLVLDKTYIIYANKIGKDIEHQVACSPSQIFDSNSPHYKELLNYKNKKIKNKKV